MKKTLLCLAPSILLAACAMDQPTTSTDSGSERVYTTGSNIPRKERAGVQTLSPEQLEQQMRNAGRTMQKGAGN